ncbi:uncharacterized protein LOC134754600 [Cydia strobilella]|uniref:uncharacterized protein LOC134754600 n=1 Tax=Cydia strobilella TaxID=1100964 RepID=UPI0030060F1A
MEDTEELYIATLEGQFASFAKMLNWSCSRDTITLYCSDYWMRQSDIIDDRRVTMTDTGIIWNTFSKAELNWDEWHEYVSELCVAKELNKLEVEVELTNCGLPGATRVYVPQYRDFFDTYKSKKALVICESLDSCGKPKKKVNKPA